MVTLECLRPLGKGSTVVRSEPTEPLLDGPTLACSRRKIPQHRRFHGSPAPQAARAWMPAAGLVAMAVVLAAGGVRDVGATDPRPTRIMAVGDSITEGGDADGYRRPLLDRLRSEGHVVEFVGSRGRPPLVHEGYGGKNAEFLAEVVPKRFHDHRPDIVLLHAGHNHFADEQPVPGIVAATESLIAAAREANPDVIVLVAQVIPSGKLPKYSYLPDLNRRLADLADRLDVILVDQASGFDWTTDATDDKVHPNAAGYGKMAARWHDALEPVLERRAAPDDRQRSDAVAGRAADLLARCVAIEPKRPTFAKEAMVPYVARLLSGTDVERAVRGWIAAAEEANRTAAPKAPATIPDPFNKHALVHAWMLGHASPHVSADAQARIVAATKEYVCRYGHREWRGYGALNFRLMSDGAGLVAAEQWPDLVDADGLDSAGIRAATRERLLGCFEEIVRRNAAEYGAPTYLGIDLVAVKMLADFAADETVRHRAALTLDTMLLHVACAWHRGYHVSPASRAKYFQSSMTGPDAMDCTAAIGWLFFAAERPVHGLCEHHAGWFAFPASYEPPPILAAIAGDRDEPFTHRGSRGATIRYTIHHEPGYALASEWTLLKTPRDYHYKESRRQMLKWVSEHPQSSFMPFQENAHRPYDLAENKANAFGYGENPFAQSLQHGRTLVGISAVPDDYPYWRIEAPFVTTGAITKRIERDGWVCCHAGSMLFAFWLGGEPRWAPHRAKERCDVLTSDARRTGWVLETAPLAPFAGGGVDAELERFAAAILARIRLDASRISADRPRLAFTSLEGHVLDITYRPHGEPSDRQQLVDGEPVDYGSFPLLGNPWVRQALDASELVIEHGGRSLRYDFAAWNRTADPDEPPRR
jgi:lysophospholipase L1-like esterase